METQRIPTSVYAEMTPNPAVMKFVADRTLVPHSHQLEFRTKAEAMTCSPLATELFNFPFVTGVFMSGSMVSVTKDESLGWEMIVQQLKRPNWKTPRRRWANARRTGRTPQATMLFNKKGCSST